MEQKEDYFIEVNSSLVDQIASRPPDEISTESSLMTLTEHLTFVAEIFNKLGINLKGEGMEVAAGASVLCCSLTRLYPAIQKMYALEIVPAIVKKLQPKIIEYVHMEGRVIPMIGDFNDIKMADNSLDFVVGFDSLHHSNDLPRTLKEIGRILKPGGKLIYFDRAQPNHMTRAQENFLLHIEYGEQYKRIHGLDPSQPYNRSDNGEHEPRDRDWYAAFQGSGMELDSITFFLTRTWRGFLKVLAAHIPYFIRSYLKIARDLTAHNKFLLYYICPRLARYGKIKIFTLNTKLSSPTAPKGKCILMATKK